MVQAIDTNPRNRTGQGVSFTLESWMVPVGKVCRDYWVCVFFGVVDCFLGGLWRELGMILRRYYQKPRQV